MSISSTLGDFFKKDPRHYWLNSIYCLVALDKYVEESLGDRSTGESQRTCGILKNTSISAKSKTLLSALRNKSSYALSHPISHINFLHRLNDFHLILSVFI